MQNLVFSQWYDVRQFHELVGAAVASAPCMPSDADLNLRVALMTEECDEIGQALDTHTLVGIVDGLVDTAYVVHGSGVTCGVQLCNVTSLGAARHERINAGDYAYIAHAVRALRADIHAFADAYTVDVLACTLQSMLDMIGDATESLGVQFQAAWDEVQRSNMSKRDGTKRADGKWIKPASYVKADIASVLRAQGWRG